jgi:hypothetical protein
MIGTDTDPAGETAAIFSGHPQISIVTVYRNMCWMRIPSLGLVEGDIIALMAGDITPGKVFELLPEEALTKNQSQELVRRATEYSEREALVELNGEKNTGGASWSRRGTIAEDMRVNQTNNPILLARSKIKRTEKVLEKGSKIHLRVRYADRGNGDRHIGSNDTSLSVLTKDDRTGKTVRKETSTYESYGLKPSMTGRVRSLYCS